MVLFYVKHVIGRKLVGMRFGWEIWVVIKGLLTQSVGTSYSRFHFHDSLCKQPVYFRQEAEMIDVKTMANSLELNFQRHLGTLNLGWNLKLVQCYIWHKYRPNNQAVDRLCEAPEKQGKPRWDEKGGCLGSRQHPISQFTIGSKWKEHCALTRSTGHIATNPVMRLEILGSQKKKTTFGCPQNRKWTGGMNKPAHLSNRHRTLGLTSEAEFGGASSHEACSPTKVGRASRNMGMRGRAYYRPNPYSAPFAGAISNCMLAGCKASIQLCDLVYSTAWRNRTHS